MLFVKTMCLLLNLPYKITRDDTVKATYTYIADGTKATAVDKLKCK